MRIRSEEIRELGWGFGLAFWWTDDLVGLKARPRTR